MADRVFGKLWFKIAAGIVGLIVIAAVAAPFAVDALVKQNLSERGASWASVARSGLEWQFKQFRLGALSADTATLTLGRKSELALANASVDLAELLREPMRDEALPPAWLYMQADPLSLHWREHVLASGIRGRVSKGRIVANGPTLSVKGVAAAPLKINLVGDLNLPRIRLGGEFEVSRAAQLQVRLSKGRLQADSAGVGPTALLLEDISAELSGSLEQVAGTFSLASASGNIAIDCASDCKLTAALPAIKLADLIDQSSELASVLVRVKIKGTLQTNAEFDLALGRVRLQLVGKGISVKRSGIKLAALDSGDFAHYVRTVRNKRIERRSGENSPDWIATDSLTELTLAALATSIGIEDSSANDALATSTAPHLEALFNGDEMAAYPRSIAQGLALRLRRKPGPPSLATAMVATIQAQALEQELGSARVFELFLNVVEWGPQVVGLGAAAHYYFDVDAQSLTARQAVFLGLLVRQPFKLHDQWFKTGNLDEVALSSALQALAEQSLLAAEALRVARAETFAWER